MEDRMEIPQKTTNTFTLWPRYCTTRDKTKGSEIIMWKIHLHTHIYSSTVRNRKDVESTKMSNSWWLGKEKVLYICDGLSFNCKKRMQFWHRQQTKWNQKSYGKWNQPNQDNTYHVYSIGVEISTNVYDMWKLFV